MDAYAAWELRGHCAQGQTLPLYLACRTGSGEVVYQTKLAGRRSGLSARELGVELLGTTIAHDVGLHVARPALINLPLRIVEAVEREYCAKRGSSRPIWAARGKLPRLAAAACCARVSLGMYRR